MAWLLVRLNGYVNVPAFKLEAEEQWNNDGGVSPMKFLSHWIWASVQPARVPLVRAQRFFASTFIASKILVLIFTPVPFKCMLFLQDREYFVVSVDS